MTLNHDNLYIHMSIIWLHRGVGNVQSRGNHRNTAIRTASASRRERQGESVKESASRAWSDSIARDSGLASSNK